MGLSSSPLPVADADRVGGLVRGNGREANEVGFETAVVDFFVEAADMLGVPKSVAAIYGICFASPAPLSFADIEERLDISRGSISQGLRVLREVGALKEVSAATDRRERFQPELALRKLVERWLDGRLQKQLGAGRKRLDSLLKTVPGGRSGSARTLKDRLKSLQTWHEKTQAVLPLVKAFLKVT